jgi:hypothetical protein
MRFSQAQAAISTRLRRLQRPGRLCGRRRRDRRAGGAAHPAGHGTDLLAVLVMQFAVPNLLRPHYLPPETTTLAMTTDAINQARNLGSITGAPVVGGLTIADAWVISVSDLRTADGRALTTEAFNECLIKAPQTGARGTYGDTAVCLGNLGLHVDVAYQPDDRYWPFLWIELTLYLGLSALLAALGLWRIARSAA